MNILLIGNGFDLEHGLPTSYSDFLEVCKRVIKIYNSSETESIEHYEIENNVNWNIHGQIKDELSAAFKSRMYIESHQDNQKQVITDNKLLNKMYSHIKDNAWLEYFFNCDSFFGENWIDFESEISRVVKTIDRIRSSINKRDSVYFENSTQNNIIINILKTSKMTSEDVFRDNHTINKFIVLLNTELDRLILALEIYIIVFVNKITIIKKSEDIKKLNINHVLSFNYSDTYARIYGKEKDIEYSYIHGKASIISLSIVNIYPVNSNLVLGIDEYLDDERKDKELEFLTFKKFYQRIYKSTGNNYLDWGDEIKDGYTDYLDKKKDKFIIHNLYIFGHSLDVTDKDVLKLFICNDNVQTKIFYYRETVNDKRTLGKLIKNLIKLIGQDELIKRTGGAHKTIEFIPQSFPKLYVLD